MTKHATAIIDGYNVLFQTPLMVSDKGQYQFELSRKRLIAFVAGTIHKQKTETAVIVFDSKKTRTELPHVEQHGPKVQVIYASHVAEADLYIEDFIIQATRPKTLLVVSSDGKIKSTARSYGATTLQARDWFDQTLPLLESHQRSWILAGEAPPPMNIAPPKSIPTESLNRTTPNAMQEAKRPSRLLSAEDLLRMQDFDEGM